MQRIKSNPILKFNDNQLQIIREAHGYEDVSKLEQDIQHLKEWIQKQSHFRVKEFDDEFLERLLIYNKGSIERTKQRLDKLCTCINLMPEFLQNFDLRNEFLPLLNIVKICVLPKPTKENYRVLVVRTTGKDDSDYHLINYYRYLLVILAKEHYCLPRMIREAIEIKKHPNFNREDGWSVQPAWDLIIHLLKHKKYQNTGKLHDTIGQYMITHDYCHGFEFIADTRSIGLGVVVKMNPFIVSKGLTLLTEGMNQRMKKIHFISGSQFFNSLLTVFKQGLSAKLKERLLIHSNVESLYEHIPREQLPNDFGGDEKSINELSDMDFLEWSSDDNIKNVKFIESIATDESLRLEYKFNEEYCGMPGSFKTLCID